MTKVFFFLEKFQLIPVDEVKELQNLHCTSPNEIIGPDRFAQVMLVITKLKGNGKFITIESD
jgi:hypothetical protein